MPNAIRVIKTDDSMAWVFVDKIYMVSEFYDDYFKKTLVRIYFENGKSLDIKNSLDEMKNLITEVI